MNLWGAGDRQVMVGGCVLMSLMSMSLLASGRFWLGVLCGCVCLGILGWIFVQRRRLGIRALVVLVIGMMTVLPLFWAVESHEEREESQYFLLQETKELERAQGRVVAGPQNRGQRVCWGIQITRMEPHKTGVLERRYELCMRDSHELSPGDQVMMSDVRLRLSPQQVYSLWHRGGYAGEMRAGEIMVEKRQWWPISDSLYSLRRGVTEGIRSWVGGDEGALYVGLLFGDVTLFSQQALEEFRATGLSHVLALSGTNVTLMVIFLFYVMGRVPFFYRCVATAILLGLFVIMVGGGASIVRAAIMGVVGLIVLHLGRGQHSVMVLLLASFFMGVVSPLTLLHDISFQLSASGVLGLILFGPELRRFFGQWVSDTPLWRELFAGTVGAQLGVLPVAVYWFGEFSLMALPANMLFGPLIPLLMALSGVLALSVLIFPVFFVSVVSIISWGVATVALLIPQWLSVPSWAIAEISGIWSVSLLVAGYAVVVWLLFFAFRSERV